MEKLITLDFESYSDHLLCIMQAEITGKIM